MKKRTAFAAAALSATLVFGAVPAVAEENTNAETNNTNQESGNNEENSADSSSSFDTNGASSENAPEGPFNPERSSNLNRLNAYLQSDQWEVITAVVAAVSALIVAISQLAVIVVTFNPDAKKQFDAWVNRLLPK